MAVKYDTRSNSAQLVVVIIVLAVLVVAVAGAIVAVQGGSSSTSTSSYNCAKSSKFTSIINGSFSNSTSNKWSVTVVIAAVVLVVK